MTTDNTPPNGSNVTNAENVSHADHVDVSQHTDAAATVAKADHVETVTNMEVHTGPVSTPRERWLSYVFRIMVALIVIMALAVTLYSDRANNASFAALNRRLTEAENKLNNQNTKQGDVLNCGRRFQDLVDAAGTAVLLDIAEIVVIISTVPATDTGRQGMIDDRIAELRVDAEKARDAVNRKSTYNTSENPLPCPLDGQPVTTLQP